MTVRAFALVLLGCATPSATEPAPNETFTLETSPPPQAPDAPPEDSPFGSSPWTGRLKHATHRYWNGCTDRREVELIALIVDGRPVPIVIGWQRASPQHREQARFLARVEDVPPNARNNACVTVTGALVTYAHEGISGAPARAIRATRIDPAPCP